jgi:UDP-N-acetylmuramate dehydrogenase
MMTASNDQNLRGELLMNEPLAGYTTWRVGGPADRLYKPADLADLSDFIDSLPEDEPLTWIGLGSNLLIRDGGIRGTVIALQGRLNEMSLLEGDRVRIESGVTGAKAARFCAREGLVGIEFLGGIPGTIGGFLAMNAGAWGGETWVQVIEVETIDSRGQLHTRTRDEYEIGYRSVQGPDNEWFVAAIFQLEQGDTNHGMARIRELLDQRNAKQPIGQPSCGSVFRNPEGDHAGRLIESCGLKGYCIGKACVSDKHANFIINAGEARAADIEALLLHVRQTVAEQTGTELIPEVRIIGEEAR